MNRLTLLRHAKSSWDSPELTDIQRPLNPRGRRDAPLMASVCAERLPPPQLVLLSPALRTRETVDYLLENWKDASPRILILDDLYLADLHDWRGILTERSGDADHITACGHQPGISRLAEWLCGDFHAEVPTAAVISLLLTEGRIEAGAAELDFFGCPRDYR